MEFIALRAIVGVKVGMVGRGVTVDVGRMGVCVVVGAIIPVGNNEGVDV